jgi:hypothetical protein
VLLPREIFVVNRKRLFRRARLSSFNPLSSPKFELSLSRQHTQLRLMSRLSGRHILEQRARMGDVQARY